MGQAKKMLMEQEENREEGDLQELLQELLNREVIEDPAKGIAKLFIAKGFAGLSERQATVLKKYIISIKASNNCKYCNNTNIDGVSDYINIMDTGMCHNCETREAEYFKD